MSDASAERTLRSPDMMGGFAKGLEVIEAFSGAEPSLTIAEIARRTGLDRSATRRCLNTLVLKNFVRAEGRYFSLTPRILRLSRMFLGATLQEIVQPTLEEIARASGEAASASTLDGNRIVYIGRSTQGHVMSMGLKVGSRLPAYCTAAGRVLLAALPPQEARARLMQGKRVALTDRTVTDVDELLDELASVRSGGYSVVDQEIEIGARSIAVPLFNISGRVVGALAIGTSTVRASLTRLRSELLPHLQAAQSDLAQTVSHPEQVVANP